jgi:Rieske Fe-S protein
MGVNERSRAVEPTRRTVLAGLAAGLVAGCTSYDNSSSGTTSSAPPSGTALGSTADVPVGGGKIFTDAQVVVTQPAAGTFKAFTSICTHQGCPVASVAGGTINCDCHGSKFAIADGSVVGGPAPAPLAPKQISVSGDTITLA